MKSSTTTTTTTTKTSKTSPTNPTTIQASMFYEPTSVLDPHLTSSPAASLPTTTTTTTSSYIPLPLPSDDWDPLSFFDPNSVDDDSFIVDLTNSLDILLPPIPPPTTRPPISVVVLPSFDRPHLDLLLKAASAFESNDVSTAHLLLSRLNNLNFGSSPLQRAAFHFKDALLSLLVPSTVLPFPAPGLLSPLEIVNRITAQKSFSDLSPIPQFTSFTANQIILEALLDSSTSTNQFIHIIDFNIGLGGQWSSFVQEIAARSKSLRSPPPQIRITAIVPDETIETLLAAENLKDFASALGIHLSVSFIHVANLGTLALSRVRINSGEAIGMVLTPTIFGLVGSSPESTSALLRFIRQASPRILVFVDGECVGCNSASFRRSFASGLEFYSSVLESLDAAATVQEEEEEEVVRRVEMGVVRPRIFRAVEGWAPREMTWRELLAGGGMTAVGFSEFTECQAEWLVRRAPVEGFHVARREGAMMLSWRGRELASTSAWRC